MQMPIEKNESSFAGLLLIGSLALGALELGAGVNGLMGSSGRGGEHNSGAALYCGGTAERQADGQSDRDGLNYLFSIS